MRFSPFGRIKITIDDRLGAGAGSAGAAIQAVWAMLATFFSDSKQPQKIGYGPSSNLGQSVLGTTGKNSTAASVLLNADYFSKTVPLNDRRAEAIMHESLHALGFAHNKIDDSYTVLNSWVGDVHNVPFLRLDDLWRLRLFFAFKDEVLLVDGKLTSDSVYSWQNQNGSNWSTFNALQKIRTSTVSYLYDIVYDSTGINTLDFSNFGKKAQIDLRASGTLADGHVDLANVHGSLIEGLGRFGKYNIYNAPNAVLHNAVGGSNADLIIGNELNNSLVGNAGNDTLIGLAGNDTLDGGEGFDTADYSRDAGTHGVIVNLKDQDLYLMSTVSVNGQSVAAGKAFDGYDGMDTLVSIEAVIGSDKDDVIFGNDAGVWLDGGRGNDQLFGGAGKDTLIGGGGDDLLNGGEGFDTADYSRDAGTHGVIVNLKDPDLNLMSTVSVNGQSVAAGKALDGFDGIDTLVSIEAVIGSNKDDAMFGNDAGVWLDGGRGNDQLCGGAGNDTLIGGAGDDTLISGGGDDRMTGGKGADLFVYTSGNVVVTDFHLKTDKLQISRSVAATLPALFERAANGSSGLVFTFETGQTLTLANVTKAKLKAATDSIVLV